MPSPSLRQAGFQVVTGSYPHVWPWVFAAGEQGSPVQDVRVRQGAELLLRPRRAWCTLLNGTAEPSVGFFKPNDPNFGSPQNRYRLDAARGRALLAEAGYNAQRPLLDQDRHLALSGSGQMLPLPMNEFLQQSLQRELRRATSPSRWWSGTRCSAALRAEPTQPQWLGADALNISLVVVRPVADGRAGSYSPNFTPRGSNAGHWRDEQFDAAFAALETGARPGARCRAAAQGA